MSKTLLHPSDQSQPNLPPEKMWAMVLGQLQMQMTQATFETWVKNTWLISSNGTWVVGTANLFAKDWLENRLYSTIQRVVANLQGRPVEIEFVVQENGDDHSSGHRPGQNPQQRPGSNSGCKDTSGQAKAGEGGAGSRATPDQEEAEIVPVENEEAPGRIVAGANYQKAFFEKSGTGYSPMPHHTSYFWLPLLGKAFLLWKVLEAGDTRSLKSINPNYWSLPKKYSYLELAHKLNRKHSRYVGGDSLECEHSRQARRAGHPLESEDDCCRSQSYEYLRLAPHPGGEGLICKHWSLGVLEILHQFNLVRVELNAGERKPTIQVWRMLPALTPHLYTYLNSELQSEYDDWLERYGSLVNIPDRQFWRKISQPNLVPLMPGYKLSEIEDNFRQRPKKQEFLENARCNPDFVPCMARNWIGL